MNVDSDTLRQVFDALDNGQRGYITVEQFTSALEKFYTSMSQSSPEDVRSPKITRMQSMDVNNIVNALDPQKDGIISFEDFQSAFQNFFNCDDREELKRKTMTLNLSGRKVSITPEDFLMSPGVECDPDLRTEDSGFLESGPLESAPSRPTTLQLAALRRNSPRLNTPNAHRRTRSSIHSIHDPAGSPFSGSRSDLMLDDVDSNFEQIRQQMRQMEAKMESMSSQASVIESDNLTGRLRDENVRLSASVAVLEERLKETESRYRRDLESERTHLESLMARSKRTYEEEIENLRGRLQKLEADLSVTTAQLSKTKVELDGARAECKRTTEALIDAQDKVNVLTEQLNDRSSAESWELQKAIADRDQAINALREVNTVVGGEHRPSTSLDTVARLEEMHQLILQLKQENKRLTKQVQDAQEESWFNNLRDGQKLLYATENSVGTELDKMTKEEVVDLLTQEKHTNNVLRTYLNSILEKVLINHPELLESRQ